MLPVCFGFTADELALLLSAAMAVAPAPAAAAAVAGVLDIELLDGRTGVVGSATVATGWFMDDRRVAGTGAAVAGVAAAVAAVVVDDDTVDVAVGVAEVGEAVVVSVVVCVASFALLSFLILSISSSLPADAADGRLATGAGLGAGFGAGGGVSFFLGRRSSISLSLSL